MNLPNFFASISIASSENCSVDLLGTAVDGSMDVTSALVAVDISTQLITATKNSLYWVSVVTGEEEDIIIHPLQSQIQFQFLLPDRTGSRSPFSAGDEGVFTVISPMNSNSSALVCRDILRTIFEKLPLIDLARSACVCSLWNSVASDRELQKSAFKAPWKLKDVVGNPISGSFWRDNSIGRFAISHRLVRGDSVTSLAVRYSVQVVDIKRLNNMMSEHGIYSRMRVLIPVSKPELLIDNTCYIELDGYAKREVAVLYLDGSSPDIKLGNNYPSSRVTSEQGRKRIIDSLKRSMQVDDGTAQYYLSISNGDPRAALTEFSEDLGWERRAGLQ
ncbi:F-box protein At1g55000 [Impatiens glandulifera]|uniref:F-box protein At1g55000 n=1 Tax=Impatiens glandulifera TaxID=253017 RepID=UPI001FB190CA|nr:F-box protein At1g55000 [Impatiens glandulifera]